MNLIVCCHFNDGLVVCRLVVCQLLDVGFTCNYLVWCLISCLCCWVVSALLALRLICAAHLLRFGWLIVRFEFFVWFIVILQLLLF